MDASGRALSKLYVHSSRMKPKSASEKRASGLKEPTWSCTMAQGLQSTRLMCAESYQPEKGTLPAAMLQQPPDAKFRYQPPVAMRCHDSISKEVWGPLGSVAVPEYASKLHYFQGVDAYCRHSLFASWPPCPPAAAPLSKEDVFFGVLTTRRLLASRARVASRTLALQGARHRIFAEFQMADNSTGYVSALPESAKLETPGSRSP